MGWTDLRPVTEDLTVSSVRDKFLWKLCHPAVKVVHDHVHDGGGVTADGWVVIDCVRSVYTMQIKL